MTSLVEFLRARLDEDERVATANISRLPNSTTGEWHFRADELGMQVRDAGNDTLVVRHTWPSEGEHIARHDPAQVLADVAAKRRIVHEHEPILRTVEWDHDQNGNGEALCCPRCQNVEHDRWNPPIGHARGLPDGFVTPYVIAPCPTLRLLALPYAVHPDYREEWRP